MQKAVAELVVPLKVDNRGSCIKLATDWVHVDSIAVCQELLPEMMQQLDVDKIQIPQLLWHAWQSLSEMLSQSTIRDRKMGDLKRSIRRKTPAAIAMRYKRRGVSGTILCPHVTCGQVKKHPRTFDRNGLICHLYALFFELCTITLTRMSREYHHDINFDNRTNLLRAEVQDTQWYACIRELVIAEELKKSKGGC